MRERTAPQARTGQAILHPVPSAKAGRRLGDTPATDSSSVAARTLPSNPEEKTDDGESKPKGALQIDVAQAVLEETQQLGQRSDVPSVSEAAVLMSILVGLVSDSRGNGSEAEDRLRWCRSIATLLVRAAKVLEKVGTSVECRAPPVKRE